MPLGDRCDCGKVCYPSRQAAWTQITSLPKYRVSHDSLTVYWCDTGGAWHLASELKNGRSRRRRKGRQWARKKPRG